MRKTCELGFAVLLIAAVLASPGCADKDATSAPAEQAQETTASGGPPAEFSIAKAVAITGACLAAALVAAGSGYSIARVGASCIESIARQPEAGGSMFAPMVVAAAMVEGGMLFAIVVCLLGVVLL